MNACLAGSSLVSFTVLALAWAGGSVSAPTADLGQSTARTESVVGLGRLSARRNNAAASRTASSHAATLESAGTESEPGPGLRRRTVVWLDTNACGGQPLRSLAQWAACRQLILQRMQSVMGPLPGPERRCALEPKIEQETDAGTFLRRLISYQVEPGQRLKAYLLVPKRVLNEALRAPAVLALHQTHALGPALVVGLANSPDDEYGVELAQRGYVVLAPPYPLLGEYQPELDRLGYQSGTMKAIWDNMRGLDLLSSLPFVKTDGFGVIGHSLGGHNGLFTAVFDERIQVVVSSCGLDSFLDYMDGDITGWTSGRYMPRLRAYKDRLEQVPFDFPEVLAALAPRACLISAPRGDTNFKWRSAAAVVQAARAVYALHGVPDRLQIEHPDCGHRFPPELRRRAYELLDAVLTR